MSKTLIFYCKTSPYITFFIAILLAKHSRWLWLFSKTLSFYDVFVQAKWKVSCLFLDKPIYSTLHEMDVFEKGEKLQFIGLTSSISLRFSHIFMGMRRSISPRRISDSPMTLCRAYLSTENTWNWITLFGTSSGSIPKRNLSLKTGSTVPFWT